jgi:hypothetical protein
MAFLFYILGWLAILFGVAWGGYLTYNGLVAFGPFELMPYVNYMTSTGLSLITPGVWTVFYGLLLLAVGGALSRLDEISYNTRSMN